MLYAYPFISSCEMIFVLVTNLEEPQSHDRRSSLHYIWSDDNMYDVLLYEQQGRCRQHGLGGLLIGKLD